MLNKRKQKMLNKKQTNKRTWRELNKKKLFLSLSENSLLLDGSKVSNQTQYAFAQTKQQKKKKERKNLMFWFYFLRFEFL